MSLEHYLDEIGRYDVLSYEEERALGIELCEIREKIRTLDEEGGEEAEENIERLSARARQLMDKLVRANLRFGVMRAKDEVPGTGDEATLLDYIQAASLGALAAARRFDPTENEGVRFVGYARHWMRAYLQDERFQNEDVASISKTQKQRAERVRRFLAEAEGDVPPRPEDVARELGVTLERVKDAMRGIHEEALDAPPSTREEGGWGTLSMHEIIAAPSDREREEHCRDLAHFVGRRLDEHLEKREAKIIRKHYGIGETREHTLGDIAARIGVSRERVRQLRNRAQRKLRQVFENDDELALLLPALMEGEADGAEGAPASSTRALARSA